MNRRQLVVLFLMLAAVAGVAYAVVDYAQKKLIEYQAVHLAEAVARLATVARSVYATDVADRLARAGVVSASDFEHREEFIPLPAQFLKRIGQVAHTDSINLYRLRPVSKWNLEPTQGLDDEFLKWAWARLEEQDRAAPDGAIDWQPVWRVEGVRGEKTLRYLWPDPASAPACVACHNHHERQPEIQARRVAAGVAPGKQWQLHQLLGALEVRIPIHRVQQLAENQAGTVTLSVAASMLMLISLAAWLLLRDAARARNLTELSWQARHDALTGLSNRRELERVLERLRTAGPHDGPGHALCVLDLDQFKPINDYHGHEAGDNLLRALAAALVARVRASDVVVRLGGDEFAVVLPSCPESQARELAIGLRDVISALEWRIGGERVPLSVSVGVVVTGARGFDSPAQLMRVADRACYAAKKAGGNAVHLERLDDREREA